MDSFEKQVPASESSAGSAEAKSLQKYRASDDFEKLSTSNYAQDSNNFMKTVQEFLWRKDEIIKGLNLNLQQFESKIKEHDTLVHSYNRLRTEAEESRYELLRIRETLKALQSKNQSLEDEIKQLKYVNKQPTDGHLQSTTQSMLTSSMDNEHNIITPGPVSMPENTRVLSMQMEIKTLNDQIKRLEFNIKKMRDMNLQWQEYDKQRENFVKLIQEEAEQLKVDNDRLKEVNQALASSSASSSQEFTPAQQEHVDRILQTVRREADQHREQAEVNLIQGQQSLRAEKELRQNAEKQSEELLQKISEMELHERELESQCEELRSALVVATRSQSLPPQRSLNNQQTTIINLKEQVRKAEVAKQKLQDEHDELKREILFLRGSLPTPNQTASVMTPSSQASSLVPPPSYSITESRNSIHNEEDNANWYEDIEPDRGQRISRSREQMTSLPVFRGADETDASSLSGSGQNLSL